MTKLTKSMAKSYQSHLDNITKPRPDNVERIIYIAKALPSGPSPLPPMINGRHSPALECMDPFYLDPCNTRMASSDSEDSIPLNSGDAPTFIMDRFTRTPVDSESTSTVVKKQPSWLEFNFWQKSYSPVPSSAQLNISPTGIADIEEMDTGCAIELN